MNQLQPNDTIIYVLLPKDQPVHPEKQWHGKVKLVVSETYILVESLERGYERDTESITFNQIKKVTRCLS